MHGSSRQRVEAAAGAAAVAGVLSCCLLLACAWSAQAAAPAIAQPDYTVYLKKDALLKKIQELAEAHPQTMKLEMRHAKDGNYSADLMVITVEPGGISPTHSNKARLLWDFGEHGREFITSEVGLHLLQVLQDDSALEKLLGSSRRLERLKAILKNTVIKVLPMENINGRDLVEGGRLCERKNGRGVDTNRNWDIDWGKKEKDYDPNEEYPGRAPHSEPEVQILLALAKELQPHVWLNVHSGMYALFTPYDHKPSVPNTPNARAALRMMKRVQELSCPQCVVGSGGHSVGYLAHGTGTDYMYEVLGVPMSFTWEIYGDSTASFEDCFRMFNPLGKQHFDEVVSLWTKALLQLLELLPSHPVTWPIYKAAGLDRPEEEGRIVSSDAAAGDAGGGQQGQASEQQAGEQQVPVGKDKAAVVATPADADDAQAALVEGDEDRQPHEEGSLWQKKEPIEVEPPNAQGTAVEASSPAAAAPAAASPAIAASPAAASPAAAKPPSPVDTRAVAVPASVAAPGAAGTTQGETEQQQPEQQQPPPELLQQEKQQEQQEEQRDIRIAGGSSGGAGLIRSNHVLPLVVGVAGLAAVAYFFSRSSQHTGPQYSKMTRML